MIRCEMGKSARMKSFILGARQGIWICVVAALTSLPVWMLWNFAIPAIFGLKTITWIQAFCLTLLCHLLFRSDD